MLILYSFAAYRVEGTNLRRAIGAQDETLQWAGLPFPRSNEAKKTMNIEESKKCENNT